MEILKSLILGLLTLWCLIAYAKADIECGYVGGEWKCWNDDDYEYDYELETGWIVAIVIAGLVVTFGVPILICFCCACLCFSGRKKSGRVHQPAVVTHQHITPGGGAYPAQPYPTQPYPAQPYPTQPYPAQPYPAQPYPAQNYGFSAAQQPNQTSYNPSYPAQATTSQGQI